MLNGVSKAATPQNNPMAMMGHLKQTIGMLRGQEPQKVALQMAQRNPQFAAFCAANQGKTVEQIAAENGIDMSFVRELMR